MAETDGLDWAKRKKKFVADDDDDGNEADIEEEVGEQEGTTHAPHEYYDEQNEEENADMGVLDYDYSSIEDKINAGLREKEKGNRLFSQKKYEQAWKQYDRCFVQIYTSKEEWMAIGNVGRKAINDFKLPCHLNRGLCRLKKDDVTNAIWDFTEALRIDESNVKALYRKGITLIRMIQLDIQKEGTDELWDLDVAEQRLNESKSLLLKAIQLSPNDLNIRNAYTVDWKQVKDKLGRHRKKYNRDQQKMYSAFISNLDKDNERLKYEEEKSSIYDDMPKLERIRITD